MRKPIIAGNWKMNKTPEEAASMVKELAPLVKDSDIDIVLCAPFVSLQATLDAAAGTNIKVGAQNMHWEENGAYTGEVSPTMLNALGVEYVIIGHSERREYFAETDETVNKKVHSALAHGLKPIICVGETLEQREEGITQELVQGQTEAALKGLSADDVKKCVIAYEPIWAIGTGKTATSEDANNVISYIRSTVKKVYGEEAANAIRIQYGGSMKPENAADLMAMSDIDGGLVGGASLKAEDFANIINF
ncbi:MAG: triose-phosphate isomerase [Clostridiales bacterium]|jgi:triosephosphate isomerase|nr:triose-phosphate isomerase [Clostridia bacterium]MDI9512911.1 triose-phosphate isomerase [Bacillota bacterium]NLH58536.1 triose-phosphate isomerase [Clostridiales bacterium]